MPTSKLLRSKTLLKRSKGSILFSDRQLIQETESSNLSQLAAAYEAEIERLGYTGLLGVLRVWRSKHENMQAALDLIGSMRQSELMAKRTMFHTLQSEAAERVGIIVADRLERFKTQIEVSRKIEEEAIRQMEILVEGRLEVFEKRVRFDSWRLSVQQRLEIEKLRDNYALDIAEEHTYRTFRTALNMMQGLGEVLENLGYRPEEIDEWFQRMLEFIFDASRKIMMEALKGDEEQEPAVGAAAGSD